MEFYMTNTLIMMCRKHSKCTEKLVSLNAIKYVQKWRDFESEDNFLLQKRLLKSWKVMGYCVIDKELARINKEFFG